MNVGRPSRVIHAGGAVFPLLTKILDAEDDLSVQVHPDDAYKNMKAS